jgi:hypothetical protein
VKKSIFILWFLIFLPGITLAQETGKGAVVAATNMNVLYMGIPNPVEIAVPGIKPERVTAEITNGTITKSANGWEVVPAGSGESVITVLVDNKKVSEKTFRIKSVPVPVAVFAGLNSGTISKEDALQTAELRVEVPDFAWDIKFNVESFTMMTSTTIGGEVRAAKGNKLTDQMRSDLASLRRDQKVIFEKILVAGPDGKIQELAPIVLKFY